MPLAAVEALPEGFGDTLAMLAATEGSASHPYLHAAELNAHPLATRNVADVLHLLSILHGAHPGLIEAAAVRNPLPEAERWYRRAVKGFAAELIYLTQLIVVAGPAPSTPGEAESAAAVLGQRHALDMIAASDRMGCAFGAVAALLLDWRPIRAVLDTAAVRIGLEVPPSILPDDDETADVLAHLPAQARLDRALIFGARQLLVQHRGLWDLIELRARARRG